MAQELAVAPHRRPPLSRKRKLLTTALVLLVAATMVGGGLFVQLRRSSPEADGYGSARTPARITAPAAITLGAPSAPHTVDVYEDPLCPYCSQFEHRFGQLLAKAVDEGKVRVTYHLLTFLDPRSATGTYSTRAAAAMLCATQENGAAFAPLHDRLMSLDAQPGENGATDRTDEELTRFAAEAGAGTGVADCLRNGTYTAVLRDTTAAVRPTIPGTPAIRLDGKPVDLGNLTDSAWADPLR
ncbi:DsbA family protein [Allokutzneria oryzae]|uniref:DsbA family protein n=1 Tax=Allokutzneria oryzae TaxID=1378989 RepID=A0ABV5ZS32_9PSEU